MSARRQACRCLCGCTAQWLVHVGGERQLRCNGCKKGTHAQVPVANGDVQGVA
jgi:hypothetical protein